MNLGKMLSNQKNGNNKVGLGYSSKNARTSVKPLFVKATNQKLSSRSVSPKFKTFIDGSPHKPKMTKSAPKIK